MPLNVTGGALEFDALIRDSQFDATIRRIEGQLQGLTKTAEKEAAAIDNLVKRTAQAIAGYATFAAGTNFLGDIIRVRGEFQQLEVAFTTMLGSKQKADTLLKEVTEFAASTPFELTEVAGATKQLLAFGISADKIKGTLRSLGDISAGIGAPLGEIAFLFGTIKTQGVALTQDVRQFAQRGIPIYQELAKIFNVTTEEVGNFITAGKVGFPEIEKAFQNMTAAGSQFGGLMEAQSKTLVGQISNLRDAWDQMLNNFGKSGENIFADAISALTFLVKNYESVLDVLKLLITIYGSYKAAVIATTVAQAIQTAAAKGYTVVELLRYRAMLLSEGAMKLLNKTMLANPFVAVATGIGAIVAALIIFGKKATEAKSKAELLADAQEKIGDSMANQEAKIRPYLEALNVANVSEQQRVDIYNKLKAIDPSIVAGLDAKTISYQSLTENVNKYLAALRNQLALEANKEAVKSSILEEQAIQKKIDAINKLTKAEQDARDAGSVLTGGEIVSEELSQLNEDLAEQKKVTEELGKTQVEAEGLKQEAKKRTLEIINDEIKAEKDKQEKFSTSSKEYEDFQKKILALEEEKKKIVGASKSETNASNAAENKQLALLEKRKELLKDIADKIAEAQQDKRSKEQTELDKINDKYDAIIKNVDEYNKKVDLFNKKNPKRKVDKVIQTDIVELNKARATELDSATLRADAERFKKNLDEKKKMFEQYEEAKKQIGIDKANELFKEETKGFTSFNKFLLAQAALLAPKFVFGIDNEGDRAKNKAIINDLVEYSKKKAEEEIQNRIRLYSLLLSETQAFKVQEAAINKKYNDLETELAKDNTIKNKDEVSKLLQQGRQDELDALKNELIRHSALYKKLNQDIIGFTRERIKQELRILKETLKNDKSLTPQQRADVQGVINQYKGLLDETNKTAASFSKVANSLGQVSGIFGDLAGSMEGLNDGLAEVFQTLSDLTSIASDAAGAIASFASGDIIGGIGQAVGAIGKLFSIGKRAREERKRHEKEIQDFMTAQFIGEQQINLLYQERAREQVKFNKLRLEGIEAEKKLLNDQKLQIQDQFNTVFQELQKQTFKVPVTIQTIFGPKTVITDQSLFGKTFEQIEELFLKGQLEGKAKELFQTLQQIKASGADIDRILAENKKAAQEIFTGTTSDSIVDSIADGFASGLRTAQDFSGKFEDMMRAAIINALKFKVLEPALQSFFEEFANASQSGGGLSSSEIEELKTLYGTIIENAQTQFDQLQQLSGLDLGGTGNKANSLAGAIRGMSESTGELLAGQFGGLRLTSLQILQINTQQLSAMNAVQINTATQIVRMNTLLEKFNAYEIGTRKLHVQI